MSKIVIIHPNDGTDVRISKTCRSLSRLGYDVHFIGWDRRPNIAKKVSCGNARLHIFTLSTKLGRNTIHGFLLFLVHVLYNLVIIRPDSVTCINEEVAVFVLPFRRFVYKQLVCELYDGLVERYSESRTLLAKMLCFYGNFIRNVSDKIVVTDDRRFNLLSNNKNKATIIGNYPEDPGDEISESIPTGKIKIYVSGSLSLARGLKEILTAAKSVGDIEIVSAGWLYDKYAHDIFVNSSEVSYKGVVTSQQSLKLASGCDAIFSFYAPTSKNNIYASPNKIYDALSVGRPIIINSETIVSNWVLENKYGWSCNYMDEIKLSEILYEIKNSRKDLPAFIQRSRSDFKANYSWHHAELQFASIYE